MTQGELSTIQREFIESQIWSLSIAGAFQHGKIYHKNPLFTDKEKAKFKSELKEIIGSKINQLNANENEGFIATLKGIQDRINAMIESNGYSTGIQHFRFGTLQKLVNLYLKYQWCIGWQPEPPHCPFDGRILERLKVSDQWTKSDSSDEYRNWVTKAQDKAESKGKTIAQWELEAWNEWLRDKQ